VPDHVTYEQPLNERVRSLMRLEYLMHRFRYHVAGESRWDTHAALITLLEVFSLTSRGDFKSELMKELERQIANLAPLIDQPQVDQGMLREIVRRQRGAFDQLHAMTGQLGQHLKNNDFLNSIRQRTSLPGSTGDFDLPAYHFWLNRPADQRSAQLNEWAAPYEQVDAAVRLILQLIRDSAAPEPRTAARGFFQQALDTAQPYQMIRIELPIDSPYHAEISAGKHRFSVRFLVQGDLASRAGQTQEDVDFELSCCSL
jgi:cell division protein ZapD